MKSIRIVSDGIKSSVFDSETGEKIERVAGVTWTHKAGEPARATVTFIGVQVEVTGQVEIAPSPEYEAALAVLTAQIVNAARNVMARPSIPRGRG